MDFSPARREARFDRTDGSMIEVRGRLIPSMLLAHSTSLELLDVEQRQPDGSYRSGLGTPDVEGAEPNTDDLVFSVRSGLNVIYRVTYRVTEASGREHVLRRFLRFGPSGPLRRDPFWRDGGD
jgi:hypothetical protein